MILPHLVMIWAYSFNCIYSICIYGYIYFEAGRAVLQQKIKILLSGSSLDLLFISNKPVHARCKPYNRKEICIIMLIVKTQTNGS